MAIYDAGYLSPIKNKLGNAVGRRWRGLPVLAVYNGNPRNPRTAAQTLQRAKLAFVSGLCKEMLPAVKEGFTSYCKGNAVFPRAMFAKRNIGSVTGSTPDNLQVDYAELVLSDGAVYTPMAGTPSFDIPNQVSFSILSTMQDQLPGISEGDFEAVAVVYSRDAHAVVVSNHNRMAIGGATTIDVEVPSRWNGMRVNIYVFAVAASDKFAYYGMPKGACSPTAYVGQGTIG